MDVERMALDPLTAVEQPTEGGDLVSDGHSAGVFDREASTRLVSNRADPADPRRDVRWLGVSPALQEGLEETRRLKDLELYRLDRAVTNLDE